jgi:hypothetical protein
VSDASCIERETWNIREHAVSVLCSVCEPVSEVTIPRCRMGCYSWLLFTSYDGDSLSETLNKRRQ